MVAVVRHSMIDANLRWTSYVHAKHHSTSLRSTWIFHIFERSICMLNASRPAMIVLSPLGQSNCTHGSAYGCPTIGLWEIFIAKSTSWFKRYPMLSSWVSFGVPLLTSVYSSFWLPVCQSTTSSDFLWWLRFDVQRPASLLKIIRRPKINMNLSELP